MFGINWLSGKLRPIGIDFGADSLKMVQLGQEGGQTRVLAAGQKHVAPTLGNDAEARGRFYGEALRQLLAERPFKGRRAITAVPSEHLFVLHLRMPRMADDELAKALPWEVQGKLPFAPAEAVLRHLVAGELFVDTEPKNEVIVMAAPRVAVERYLGAIARAKLDVQTILVPPLAVLEAFRFLFTRAEEHEMCTLFVDMGAAQTCAMITQATRLVFVKQIPVGGYTIDSAIAARLNCSRAEAARLRIAQERSEAADSEPIQAARGLNGADTGTAVAVAPPPKAVQNEAILAGSAEPIERLARELAQCVRYYETLFPDRPLDRLVFLGGETHFRRTCQHIARALRLPAQLGDPMLRMHRTHQATVGGELPPGAPAPEWAIAFGCSLAGDGIS